LTEGWWSSRDRRKSLQKRDQELTHRKNRFEEEEDEDGGLDDVEVEEYWFVCSRWFAKGEDDDKIVRELLPTTEDGQPLDTGLQGMTL